LFLFFVEKILEQIKGYYQKNPKLKRVDGSQKKILTAELHTNTNQRNEN
jgi:hypothetical protein